MNTSCVGVAALAALLLTEPAGAQAGRSFPDPTTLVGPGSSIGVRVRDVTDDDVTQAKLEPAGGVYVEEVEQDTPADRAGLRNGDIVTEFDGERVRSVRSFRRLVSETPPQRTVQATVIRNGSRMSIAITPEAGDGRLARDFVERFGRDFPMLRAMPRAPRAVPQPPPLDVLPAPRRLGVTLAPLDGQLAEYFGVTSGVLVSAVDRDSPAARAGLRAGDVISAVNGRTVRRPGDVTEAVRDAADGGMLDLKIVRDRKALDLRVTVPGAGAPAGSGRVPV